MLGVNTYGNRAIAKNRGDKIKVSETFWQIFYIQLFLTLFFGLGYIIGVFWINPEGLIIFLLQGFHILSAITDVNWFAYGLEKFKFTTIRSCIIKIVSIICIFIFIKSPDDLWKYTLIINLGNIISLLIIWPLIIKETYFVRPNLKKVVKHIKPNFILFIPYIASSVYQYIDKIMLGILSTNAEVGYYNYAENIVSIPMGLVTAVTTVMLPHVSNLIVQGKEHHSKKVLDDTIRLTTILNIGIVFGLIASVKTFIPWYLGENYIRTAELIQILSISILVAGFSNVIRAQYLIPKEKDKIYLLSIIVGALMNIILNVFLIKTYQASGAAISTICAHLAVMIIQNIFTRNEIQYKKIFVDMLPFVFFGMIMMIVVYNVSLLKSVNILGLFVLEVLLGIIVYLFLCVCWIGIRKRINYKK